LVRAGNGVTLRFIKSRLASCWHDPAMSSVTENPAAERDSTLTDDTLRRFDTPGPRYTSYPSADRFTEAFGVRETDLALQQRRRGTAESRLPLSLYVHIPFCESLCYYCACNKIITRHHERAGEYLDVLEAEVELVAARLGSRQSVSQLHFGGGSPTFLSNAELSRTVQRLAKAFSFSDDIEMSIEVDPRTVTPERLACFRELGFNRISFGVQDFDAEVQQAVHRIQSFEAVGSLMASASALGFRSTNVDLIYGLPKQTRESFARTIGQVGRLRPDRIALYAYAHLPARFKPQRRILPEHLPGAATRVSMLGDAIAGFLSFGYDYIGMDHFALGSDSLAVAKRQGKLHRNFQGYSTQPDCDLIGLGVSSIGRVGDTYYQNAKSLPEYYEAVRNARLPVVRGYALSRDDLVRRAVIMGLMCQGRVEYASIEASHLVDFGDYFGPEMKELERFEEEGLVERERSGIRVTPRGWFLVRAVAAVFDRHLRGDQRREGFSKVI
jgi:oxygen-independent coproporphyrinogen-3 oxidase